MGGILLQASASTMAATARSLRLFSRRLQAQAPVQRRYAGGKYNPNFESELPEPHGPSSTLKYAGTGMAAVMWFWILWRAKHDLPHLLGWEHPWDHMEEHGEHH